MATSIGINDLKDISTLLFEKTGYPFNDMPLSFFKRQINQFFDKNRIRNIFHFTEQLNNPIFVEYLLRDININCTEMFRDPGFWRVIKTRILPIIDQCSLPVWFPDSASGEELQSFLIIKHLHNPQSQLSTYFNNPSTEQLNQLMEGIITTRDWELTESNFKRLEIQEAIEKFIFTKQNHQCLQVELLKQVIGEKGWFLNTPVDQKEFSLIIIRNSMLYMNKSLQEKLCNHLYNLLTPGGYLAIGIKENIPEIMVDKFELVDQQERIFRKHGILKP
jgi:chemotaxis protein methyltransferase CheR